MDEVSLEAGNGFSGYFYNLLNKSSKNKVQTGWRKRPHGHPESGEYLMLSIITSRRFHENINK